MYLCMCLYMYMCMHILGSSSNHTRRKLNLDVGIIPLLDRVGGNLKEDVIYNVLEYAHNRIYPNHIYYISLRVHVFAIPFQYRLLSFSSIGYDEVHLLRYHPI